MNTDHFPLAYTHHRTQFTLAARKELAGLWNNYQQFPVNYRVIERFPYRITSLSDNTEKKKNQCRAAAGKSPRKLMYANNDRLVERKVGEELPEVSRLRTCVDRNNPCCGWCVTWGKLLHLNLFRISLPLSAIFDSCIISVYLMK